MSAKPFMDAAEELGIREVLVGIANAYAGVGSTAASTCACSAPMRPRFDMDGELLRAATHDLACPIHRLMVLCGSDEARAKLANDAHSLLLLALDIDANPDHRTYSEVVLARRLLMRPVLGDAR
jgi:hypothetical protein